MVVLGGSSIGLAVAGIAPASGNEPVPAILWVPDDDVRLLLRGILTLQHHPVVLEVASAESLRRWEPTSTALFVLDAVSGAARWREELTEALKARPELRPIVLLPRDSEAMRHEAESLGARATLVRPFAVRDLVAAIREALRSPTAQTGA
jgi:DNA-binding NarL/FixJ family response regulator